MKMRPQLRRDLCVKPNAGVASVEAALVLPVLGLALIGVMFLRQLHAAQDEARRLARRCALEFATAGCEPARTTPECRDVLSSTQLASGGADARRLRQAAGDRDTFGVFDLPLISEAIAGLFGTAVRAEVAREVSGPWAAAPAQVTVAYAVLCNDRPRDVGAAIERVFCEMVPVVKCR
jgi:hypothetical protein